MDLGQKKHTSRIEVSRSTPEGTTPSIEVASSQPKGNASPSVTAGLLTSKLDEYREPPSESPGGVVESAAHWNNGAADDVLPVRTLG